MAITNNTAPRDRSQTLSTGVTYALVDSARGTPTLQPAIQVTGGVVNIYGSLAAPATPPSDMVLARQGENFSGIDVFAHLPNFMYFTTVSGTPEIRIVGAIMEAV